MVRRWFVYSFSTDSSNQPVTASGRCCHDTIPGHGDTARHGSDAAIVACNHFEYLGHTFHMPQCHNCHNPQHYDCKTRECWRLSEWFTSHSQWISTIQNLDITIQLKSLNQTHCAPYCCYEFSVSSNSFVRVTYMLVDRTTELLRGGWCLYVEVCVAGHSTNWFVSAFFPHRNLGSR